MKGRRVPKDGIVARSRTELRRETVRRYNRAYMRRWRAYPRNLVREQAARSRARFARKERQAREGGRYTNCRGQPVCGFCWCRRPVWIAERLMISELARGGYERVRIPYCGEC